MNSSVLSASCATLMLSMKFLRAPIKVSDNVFDLTAIVLEMKRFIREMIDEVETVEKGHSIAEDHYSKLE